MRKMCSSKQRPSLSQTEKDYVFRSLIVDDEHRFIYCVVPKTGVTSWKSALLVLMGKEESIDGVEHINVHSRYRYLSTYPAEKQRQWRLKNYTKIMVHRDPLIRLISAYFEKFSVPSINRAYHRKHGIRIISMYRPGASRKSLETGTDVKFEEFVKYVLDGHMDPHWIPASTRCQPCHIDYDYYAATETADEDSVPILLAIGAPHSLHLPHSNEQKRPWNKTHYFSLLSRQSVERILKLYEDDFLLFGYDIPDVGSLTNWSD